MPSVSVYSLLARGSSGAGHEVGALLNMVVLHRESFEVAATAAVRGRCCRKVLGLQSVHLFLKLSDSLFFRQTHFVATYMYIKVSFSVKQLVVRNAKEVVTETFQQLVGLKNIVRDTYGKQCLRGIPSPSSKCPST